ncbi:MAG: hypothetical protein AB1437_13825 [Pseudomonadota bacterium]
MNRPRQTFILLVLAGCAVLNLILVGLYLQLRNDLAQVKTRLASMEAAIQKREDADPLQAQECVELDTGDSPDKPCMTTIRRLALAPQQFHDRWVLVRGLYAGGFELSALFEAQENRSVMAPGLDSHAALWVPLGLPYTPEEMPLITVSGKFKRGPSGHLRQFFGELVDAEVRGRSRQPAR